MKKEIQDNKKKNENKQINDAVLSFATLQTINVRAKVNLADIVVLEHRGVASVGRVVCSTVIEGAAGRKSKPRIQPVLFN